MERTLVGILLLLILVLVQGAMAAETYGYVTKWGGLGSGDGQFKNPGGVAVDPWGNVYVADTANSRIEKFTSDGITLLAKWGSSGSNPGQFSHPQAVVVDSSGNVYVVDTWNNRIEKFTPDGGTLLANWGSQGSGAGQFFYPHGIAIDSSGNVYVADTLNHRIEKFTSNGETLLAKWGSEGSGDNQFEYPWGVAVDSSGNVYVADTDNQRVQKFTSDGRTLLAKWGSLGSNDGQFAYASDIAVDSSGNVYVSDSSMNRIQKFTPDGSTLLAKWGSQGSNDGQFNSPEGLVVDSSSHVYVADTLNHRIEEFAKGAITGDIAVTSDPGSAEIYLDGFDTGIATKPGGGTVQWVTLTGISPGTHTVKVSLPGYLDATQQVTVTAGSITSAKFQMVPVAATGSIHVTSDPVGSKGSNIFLDGVDTGQFTDATLTGITPGIYTVQAAKYTLPFYTAPKQQVTVTAGLTTDVHFDMRMYGIGSIYVKAGCPVDITVTDPQGHTISSQNNDIPGASYVDLGPGADGRPDPMIAIPASDGAGTYLVTVIPKPGTQPTDTYTLDFMDASGKTIVLADNVPISAITDKPYSFTVSGTEPVPEYPVPAVPALCIAMFALGIIALKVRRD